MIDIVAKQVRSRMMSGIKNKNTKPELLIRKGLFSQGFRYKLHDKSLPGKPDLVLPKYSAVIQVHGCFWHGHNCHLFKLPKSRAKFWRDKISGNRKRDKKTNRKLNKQGWYLATVWECSLKGKTSLPIEVVIDEIAAWLKFGTNNLVVKGKKR